MATTCCPMESETDNLITCGVCRHHFDAECRKPKFLPCSHTLCLQCLTAIKREAVVICALCRKPAILADGVCSLPDNVYALKLLKLSTQDVNPARAPPDSLLHSTVKDLEGLIALKEGLKKFKALGQNKLPEAVRMRRQVQSHLDTILKALKEVEAKMVAVQEDNNLKLAELSSRLDELKTLDKVKDGGLLEELILFVGDCKPEDSLSTLREKVERSTEKLEAKLGEAEACAGAFNHMQKTRISVKVLGPKVSTPSTVLALLEKGFVPSELGRGQEHLALLSHVFFALTLTEGNTVQAASTPNTSVAVAASTPSTSAAPTTVFRIPTGVVPSPAKFVLKVLHQGVSLGEIHIEPSSRCSDGGAARFIRSLLEFCFRSPKSFSQSVSQALAGIFVLVPFSHSEFRPDIPELAGSPNSTVPVASKNGQVGITLVITEQQKVAGWSLIFPLNFYSASVHAHHLKGLAPATLFGQITQGLRLIVELSQMKKAVKNKEFSFSLESKA